PSAFIDQCELSSGEGAVPVHHDQLAEHRSLPTNRHADPRLHTQLVIGGNDSGCCPSSNTLRQNVSDGLRPCISLQDRAHTNVVFVSIVLACELHSHVRIVDDD